MDRIEIEVANKLREYKIGLFDEIDEKNKVRLVEIERYINRCREEVDELVKQAKLKKPNIKKLAEAEEVSITRKTLYNNVVLKQYAECEINRFPDYFNEVKIKKLQDEHDELQEVYNKVIENIIDDYNTKNQIETLMESINCLKDENKILRKIIEEKNEEISRLKKVKDISPINILDRG